MKTSITLTIVTASLLALSSCCGPSVSKRLPNLPGAPVMTTTAQPTPINVTPTK